MLRGLSGAAVIASAEVTVWPRVELFERYLSPKVVRRPEGVRDPRYWTRVDEAKKDTVDNNLHEGDEVSSNRKMHQHPKEQQQTHRIRKRDPSPLPFGPTRSGHPTWNPPGSPLRFLNAGTLMGRAVDIAELLRRLYVDDCSDDQLALTTSYLRPDVVSLSFF